MRGGENMDAESFYSLLFNLYAEHENIKIEYELDNSCFSTDRFNEKHACCRGTVSLSSDTAHLSHVQEDRETEARYEVLSL